MQSTDMSGGQGLEPKKGTRRQNDSSFDLCNLKLASNWLLRNNWNTQNDMFSINNNNLFSFTKW